MSEPQIPARQPEDSPERMASSAEPENGSSGINLKLLYTILAVALAAAIGLALLIVLPFYQRR